MIFEELKVNNAKVFAIFVAIPAHASAGSVRGPGLPQHNVDVVRFYSRRT